MSLGDTIAGWIAENCAVSCSPDDLTHESLLLEDGVLDSLQIVNLITFLEEETGVPIDMEEVVPENFATIDHIVQMVSRAGGHSSADP